MTNIYDRHYKTPMTDMININDRHGLTPMTRMTESNYAQRPRSNSRSNGVGFEMMGYVRLWGDTFKSSGYTLVSVNKTRVTMHPVTLPHPFDISLRLGLVSGTVVYRPSRALKVMFHRLYREFPPCIAPDHYLQATLRHISRSPCNSRGYSTEMCY